MSEEMDYNITPVTHNCTNSTINKSVTQINTPAHHANVKLDNSANQAQEYLQSYGPNKKASLYNKWYIPQYNIGVINSKGSNILPN